MSLTIISDTHISSPSEPLYEDLLAFLGRVQQPATLIFLGDVFDLFLGPNRKFFKIYERFFSQIQKLTDDGCKVLFFEGNHDFSLSGSPCLPSGLEMILKDDILFIYDGKKFALAHGDLADSRDYGYRLLRKVLRSSTLSFFIRIVPAEIVIGIGKWMSRTSKGQNYKHSTGSEGARKIYRAYAGQLSKKYRADVVVLGHCHDPDSYDNYINVGYPKQSGEVLRWSHDKSKFIRQNLIDLA